MVSCNFNYEWAFFSCYTGRLNSWFLKLFFPGIWNRHCQSESSFRFKSFRPGTSRSRMVNYDGSLINFSWYKCILISDSPGKCLPVRIICLNLWDFLQSFSRGKGLCLLRRLWLQHCFIVGQQETVPSRLSLWWEESECSDSTSVQWVCHQMFTWVKA